MSGGRFGYLFRLSASSWTVFPVIGASDVLVWFCFFVLAVFVVANLAQVSVTCQLPSGRSVIEWSHLMRGHQLRALSAVDRFNRLAYQNNLMIHERFVCIFNAMWSYLSIIGTQRPPRSSPRILISVFEENNEHCPPLVVHTNHVNMYNLLFWFDRFSS